MAEKNTTAKITSRRAKKTTVREAEVKPTSTPDQEPSNQPATSRTDDPAKRGYMGSYSSHYDSRDPGVDNG